jgi:hypothetical protein
VSYAFVDDHTVQILALGSVLVLDQLNLDVFGDVNRVIEDEGVWLHCEDGFVYELRE